jgi:RES domain-containing protein
MAEGNLVVEIGRRWRKMGWGGGRWKTLAAALIYFGADLSAALKRAQVFGLAASR